MREKASKTGRGLSSRSVSNGPGRVPRCPIYSFLWHALLPSPPLMACAITRLLLLYGLLAELSFQSFSHQVKAL